MVAVDVPVQLRFLDVDMNRHVNNGAYFQLLESARVYLARTPMTIPGSSETTTLAACIGPSRANFVTDHYIEYRRPLEFRLDPVIVRIRVTRIGRSSFDYGYEVTDADASTAAGSTAYVVAHTGMVIASRETGKGDPIDERHRALLESLMGEPPVFRRFGTPA